MTVGPTRHSRAARSVGPPRRKQGNSILCNHPRCQKKLSTTVFVCACDCVFCEECTYTHFNTSSNCPTCNRTLTESDFSEVTITDQAASQPNRSFASDTFRTLFSSAHGEALTFQDMCKRAMQLTDECKTVYKFLMKQFLLDTSQMTQRLGYFQKMVMGLKEENAVLKRSRGNDKAQMQKALSELQQKNGSLEKKVSEKEVQLSQFRRLHGSMTPASPHDSLGSGGQPRRVSAGASQAPPMRGFMMQKEANERAQQRMLQQPTHHRTPFLGGSASVAPRVSTTSQHPSSYAQSSAEHSYMATHDSRLHSPYGQEQAVNFPYPGSGERKRGRSESEGLMGRHSKATYRSPTHAFAHQNTSHHGGGPASFFNHGR